MAVTCRRSHGRIRAGSRRRMSLLASQARRGDALMNAPRAAAGIFLGLVSQLVDVCAGTYCDLEHNLLARLPGPCMRADGMSGHRDNARPLGIGSAERSQPNRISSSGRDSPDRFRLDQDPWSVLVGLCRTALNCSRNCNLAVTLAAVFRSQRCAMGYGGEVPASGGGESTEV
jgi:hypothetical protein